MFWRRLRQGPGLGCLVLGFLAAGPFADLFTAARERMVRLDIEARGIHNPEVLRAMRATPRHLFVPPRLQDQAYADIPLPIGHRATISQPFIVAMMTELLEPDPAHRVLEIGTGSGYQAAILAQLAKHVYSIEIVPELAKSAREALARMGYRNVTVRQGDGYQGWPEEAPFDRIVVTAAPPEIPRALIDQLRRGGRLVLPVGELPNQELVVLEKKSDGSLSRRSAGAVWFVPMQPRSQ